MACQDVQIAMGCRVVCRPALQHHHPVIQTHAVQITRLDKELSIKEKNQSVFTSPLNPRENTSPAWFIMLSLLPFKVFIKPRIYCNSVYRQTATHTGNHQIMLLREKGKRVMTCCGTELFTSCTLFTLRGEKVGERFCNKDPEAHTFTHRKNTHTCWAMRQQTPRWFSSKEPS